MNHTLEIRHGRDEFLGLAWERGYLHQMTDRDGLSAKLAVGPVTAYLGFDLTANSLHVGHLLPIMLMRLWARCGHQPLVLWGRGTSMIGDPSGRDTSRTMLSEAEIDANLTGMVRSIDALLGAVPHEENNRWLKEWSHIDFLREIGQHFSVNRMLTMDSVANRLDKGGLSYLEFGYMLLQSYDFVALHQRRGVEVQFGGSDQWGNIVMGIDLIRKMRGETAFGVTVPLLATASGQKMGKTANGAVWLNPERLSPYDYWQFWRNTEDADVERFLRLFTELAMDEVMRLGALGGAEINEAKKVLATEATALLHGRKAAQEAAETARQTFEAGVAAEGLPTVSVALLDGMGVVAALVESGLANTNGEARRLIEGGGVRVNDAPVTSTHATLTLRDLRDDSVKLSVGKRRHVLVRQA